MYACHSGLTSTENVSPKNADSLLHQSSRWARSCRMTIESSCEMLPVSSDVTPDSLPVPALSTPIMVRMWASAALIVLTRACVWSVTFRSMTEIPAAASVVVGM